MRGQVISYGFPDRLNYVQVYSKGSIRCKQFLGKWKKIGISAFDLCEDILVFYALLCMKLFLYAVNTVLFERYFCLYAIWMIVSHWVTICLRKWGSRSFYWCICFLVSFNMFVPIYDVLLLEDCISLSHCVWGSEDLGLFNWCICFLVSSTMSTSSFLLSRELVVELHTVCQKGKSKRLNGISEFLKFLLMTVSFYVWHPSIAAHFESSFGSSTWIVLLCAEGGLLNFIL